MRKINLSIECIMCLKTIFVSGLVILQSTAIGSVVGVGFGGAAAVVAAVSDKNTTTLTKILLPVGGLAGGATLGLLVGTLIRTDKLIEKLDD